MQITGKNLYEPESLKCFHGYETKRQIDDLNDQTTLLGTEMKKTTGEKISIYSLLNTDTFQNV